jgi:hypothetical protein
MSDALLAKTLAWTGARISEALELVPLSFQVEACVVTIRTLKRAALRRAGSPYPTASDDGARPAFENFRRATRSREGSPGYGRTTVSPPGASSSVRWRCRRSSGKPHARAASDIRLALVPCKRACLLTSPRNGLVIRGSARPRSMPPYVVRRSRRSLHAIGRSADLWTLILEAGQAPHPVQPRPDEAGALVAGAANALAGSTGP